MPSNVRGNRKERVGVVTSDKMDKTITVKVDWVTHHPVYKKLMRRATKFKAHDEKNSAGLGDTVKIRETRPLSKTKRWILVEIVKKASSVPAVPVAQVAAVPSAQPSAHTKE
jgi:small subunit ribosomal protein S17